MEKAGNWKPHNVRALEQNVALVFRTGDISKLHGTTYRFMTLDMGFIAHYDLGGFQSVYGDDLENFRLKLQTSEYSSDPDYNLKWADQYEGDREFNKWYGPAYCKSVAEGIRRIVAIARDHPGPPVRTPRPQAQPVARPATPQGAMARMF